ncbi:MAG: YlxR family protein [Christensenellaceae bacterium]|jgi:predicted RNA-binding protein YlxR (DUF448 family)|nr:YlxR family protein [Christensenellaceae bacterium]
MKKVPLRMCIVCRQMKTKAELVRVTKTQDGQIFVDDTKKADGRGAYVCSNNECLHKCIKTHALNRAYKKNVDNSSYEMLQEHIRKN